MVRRILAVGLLAAAVACSPQKSPKKSGPVVASGKGITITADEFKARLDEQSPFIRARYSSLDRKKEFLDNLIRFEVLAKEAERQGLDKDPDVQNTLKKIMVQKLVQKNFQDTTGTGDVPDADVQKYFDDHKDEYNRPRRVRVAAAIWNAPQVSPDRAKKLAAAQKALAKLKIEEKKNTLAFAQIVAEFSEDPATKAAQGDLQFKSYDELVKAYSKEVADAAFKLKAGETSPVVQSPQGIYLLKYTGEQPELVRTVDQVKAQIASKLHREKKTKEFDEWLKKLRETAQVTTDDKALDAVEVAAAPATPGMAGHGGVGGMMPAPSATPAPAAPAPVPQSAPAKQ
jgi:parvulin-like peptidyl-prolyl cis-trans isomerase-like protein